VNSVHAALVAARGAVTELQNQLAGLDAVAFAAQRERETADEELARVAGLELLGEATPAQAKAARARAKSTEDALAASTAAREIVSKRLAVAQKAVVSAEAIFYEHAADALIPERDRLRMKLRQLFEELEPALEFFARVDAVTSRIPIGTRSGESLLKAAGIAVRQVTIQVGVRERLGRLDEKQILEVLARQ